MVAKRALEDTPVVVLNGPRQSGKSTLAAQLIAGGYDADYVSLDDSPTLAAALRDPDGFIAGLPQRVVIDEVQRAPAIFKTIKASVDRNRRPGRFLLTGSASVLLHPAISESLAGRSELITLWPLSQGEIEQHREEFVDAVFREEIPRVSGPVDGLADSLERALRGGFPDVVLRPDERRAAWFRSYVTTVLERDVRDLGDIARLTEMPRLLGLIAARTASTLNLAELSRATEIPQTTLTRYVSLLMIAFLVVRIPAWSGGLSSRLVRHPKFVLSDAGLTAHLQGLSGERFSRDPSLSGPLLETFVAMELHKQISWSRHHPSMYHFRTRRSDEVDLVLERRDGRLVGIEVKASASVDHGAFRGLHALSQAQPRKFHRGIVLYTGAGSVPFGRSMHAMPVSALWLL